MRDGYVADWRGHEYEASPDGDDVRLYRPSRTRASRRSGPAGTCGCVPADRGRRTSLRPHHVHLAGRAVHRARPSTTAGCGWSTPAARRRSPARSGLEEFDFGVYQGWAPVDEVTDLSEYRV